MIDQILETATGDLTVSRALAPSLKSLLLRQPGARELPCIRGHTVVPEVVPGTLIVGYPNHLGVFDRAMGTRTILLTGVWSSLRPIPDDTTRIVVEEPVTRRTAEVALDGTRWLAKRLRQVRGVQLAIKPQSPIIVALLPITPGSQTLAVAGVTALGDDFPEYAAGIRIEPPFNAGGFDLSRYAADLERIIVEEA